MSDNKQSQAAFPEVEALDYRLDWIRNEVDILEHKIEAYDELSIKLKQWTVVSWFALISFAVQNDNWKISILSPLIPLLFMLTDASYKRIQMAFMTRTRHIMNFLNKPTERAKWQSADGRCTFPIYDILNVYGDGIQRDPANNQAWGPILVSLRKDSVNFLYWCLIVVSFIVTVVLQCCNIC